MSLARDILDRVFFPNRDVHAIPVLDGGFSPNRRLDEATVLDELPGADGICIDRAGSVYVSAGRRIVRYDAGDFSARSIFAELDGQVGALAAHPDGRILAGVAGKGIVALDAAGRRAGGLDRAGDAPLHCVTAIAILPDGSIAVADGSRDHASDSWLHDMMRKGPGSGRVVITSSDLTSPRLLLDRLSWPAGLAAAEGRILVTEAWTHRLLGTSPAGGNTDVVVKNFAGYPCRLAGATGGGLWLAFFAMRTQLTEFVLREDAFRTRMMATVPPELWIGPSLGGQVDYREPTQVGRIKKLGIQKPWAPPRSYGLVARIEAGGSALESLHSRVSGELHGITDMVEAGGRLIVVSKGHGKLAAIEIAGGRPS
jgi:sugar lactone lactonase YvrE